MAAFVALLKAVALVRHVIRVLNLAVPSDLLPVAHLLALVAAQGINQHIHRPCLCACAQEVAPALSACDGAQQLRARCHEGLGFNLKPWPYRTSCGVWCLMVNPANNAAGSGTLLNVSQETVHGAGAEPPPPRPPPWWCCMGHSALCVHGANRQHSLAVAAAMGTVHVSAVSA